MAPSSPPHQTDQGPRIFAALIRHGEYEQPPGVPSALLPHPLTDRGREQAHECALRIQAVIAEKRLVPHPIVDCSVSLRAYETARIVAEHLDLGLNETEALCERRLGAAANLTVEEIEQVIRLDPRVPNLPSGWKSMSQFRLPLPGAESLWMAGARVATHIASRCRAAAAAASRESETRDRLVIFVGHGASFRHAAVDLGVLQADQLPKLSMHHARAVFLERTGEGKWRHDSGEWKLRKRVEAPD